jgi:Reverse transcriptase (RNA-dependent DNA polymerase)
MANVPNHRHTELLLELCNNLHLLDPFRALYPDKKMFTFSPRFVGARNKSRLDFFLISNSFLGSVTDCAIADSLQSSLFDHKAVTLAFSGKKKFQGPYGVCKKIFTDPEISLIVQLAVIETFLIYQDRDPVIKNRLLTTIGTARYNLREVGLDPHFYKLNLDPNSQARRLERIAEINHSVNSPVFLDIPDFPVNIDADVFFDMLVNHVNNEIISYQTGVFRYLSKGKRNIIKKLSTLRNSNNSDEIELLESNLRQISEFEIERALEHHHLFEHLNGEKMSPHFLKLCKGIRPNSNLEEICDNDGNAFPNDLLRSEFIVKFFENIYQVPEDAPVVFENLITTFLGPEICNNPIVLGSMLSPEESALLDSDLSLIELDKAAQEGDIRTAAGADGVSNAFVKKFWSFFRVPLLNNINHCFRLNCLTDNFRTTNIRLIPKKGNSKSIKNWRPISLLSCFYKVVSQAVNNRLKKFSYKFTSRAQKGFTPSRQLHEVLINIVETMSYCRSENISAALVTLDQAKAFDTILHGYVRETFKFFGVGNKFLDMLDTLGTNRSAQIILDNNKLSRPFNLGTGRPQGDCTSPIEFNVGEQILLFKIELDTRIQSVYIFRNVPRNLFPVDYHSIHPNFRLESNSETDKADGLADDTSAIHLMERQSLLELKNVLNNFSKISGLKCNLTKLMCYTLAILMLTADS